MNKIMVFCLGILLLSLALFGCSIETSTGTGAGSRDYFPNTDGYSWTFLLSSPGTTETFSLKCTASGTTTVGSQTVQKVRAEMTSGTRVATSEFLVKVTDTDVQYFGTSDYPTTEGSRMIAFPLSVGNHWAVYGTQEASVTAKENVTVSSGSYNDCYKISIVSVSPFGGSTMDYWLAKNVGVVKGYVISYYGTSVSTTEMVLTAKNF